MSANESATHLETPDIAVRVGPAGLEGVSLDQLRAVVQTWTQMLRKDGLPPERVLAAVKAFVRESARASLLSGTEGQVDEAHYQRDLLVKQASAWCIEAYYAEVKREP